MLVMALHALKQGEATSSEPGQSAGGQLAFRYWLSGLSVLLLLIVGIAYLPSLRNDFVNYDDNDYVTGNTEVQKGLHWSGIQWAFSKFAAANWHPLTWML